MLTKYFDRAGPQNTDETLKLSKQRALELGVNHVVVATRIGDTALKAADIFKGTQVKLVTICHQYGHVEPGKILVTPEVQEKLKEKGVLLATSTMILGSLGKVFRPTWEAKGYTQYLTTFPFDVIADTLRMFCQGMKVCVEIIVMSADMGLIPIDRDVISIAGSHRGADTAIVAKPAHTQNFFDLRIREIIAKPRQF